LVAIPHTFGNHLKFGLDSRHDTKGRPTFLHWEREHLKLRVNTRTFTLRGALQRGPAHARELSPRLVVERGPRWQRQFFPLPFQDWGRASTH